MRVCKQSLAIELHWDTRRDLIWVNKWLPNDVKAARDCAGEGSTAKM